MINNLKLIFLLSIALVLANTTTAWASPIEVTLSLPEGTATASETVIEVQVKNTSAKSVTLVMDNNSGCEIACRVDLRLLSGQLERKTRFAKLIAHEVTSENADGTLTIIAPTSYQTVTLRPQEKITYRIELERLFVLHAGTQYRAQVQWLAPFSSGREVARSDILSFATSPGQ